MQKKTIIISGAYGDGNLGDDFLLKILVDWLESLDKNYHIKITARENGYLKKMFPRQRIISKALAKYIDTDILILGGGTQFFSFGSSDNKHNRFFIYSKLILREPFTFLSFIKSKLIPIKKPLKLALGIGLGPFYSKNIEFKTKNLLESFNHIYCRDKVSSTYCDEWNIPNKLVADMCLSNLFTDNYTKIHQINNIFSPKVGVVLRDWKHNLKGDNINNKIKEWVKRNPTIEIEFFIFSEHKDSVLIDDISKQFKDYKLNVWSPQSQTFNEYLTIFNKMDIILTSRYHAAIFATSFQIPTICLDIDPKLKHLTDEVDGFYYWESEGSTSLITDTINNIASNYISHQRRIGASLNLISKRANKMFDELLNILQ